MILYLAVFAIQATRKNIMRWLKHYLARGSQLVLEVWPLHRQATLAARPSCEQGLLDRGSLAIGCSCVPLSPSCPLRKAWQGCLKLPCST